MAVAGSNYARLGVVGSVAPNADVPEWVATLAVCQWRRWEGTLIGPQREVRCPEAVRNTS